MGFAADQIRRFGTSRVPINELLSSIEVSVDGRVARQPLTDTTVSDVIRAHVLSDVEKARREKAILRDKLYRSGGEAEMADYIESVFRDPEVKRLRKQWVAKAKFNNSLRRIVHEIATVYQQPALRKVASGNDRYQEAVRRFRLDQAMREADRLLMLHNDLVIGPRIREERGQRRAVIDLVHPGHFFAVPDALDHTRMVALVFDISRPGLNEADPHFVLWTDAETAQLDGKGRIIAATRRDHGFERMPFVLAHAVPPTLRGMLLDPDTGGDLVSAHFGVWFQNILIQKESKSAGKQTAFLGDTSGTPRGQSQDSERDLLVGEGVTVQTIDRGSDIGEYRATADFIEERAAGNHGLPPAILRHQGATSGHEIELRLLPIKALREERILVWREVERELVEVMAMVARDDLPEVAYSPEGFSIDYGEIQVPLNPTERTMVFVANRQAGLTDTIEELKARNPDLDDGSAFEEMKLHIERETTRNELMRPLAEIQGSMNGQPGAQAGGDDSDELDEVDALVKKANAVGILIRAGFDAEDAARTVGIDVKHLGLLPITLQDEEGDGGGPPANGGGFGQ